ncbi:tetratricopeptide repeat protein [Candidatus Uabimicrobium amorphum]|uniref:Secretin/TonB short N-terminal domain-containing protein n=1 Tax=Uabimicrobium amorphum TaxID=2596890 RepID=A0A5S9F0U6_UABAM|nr:tetratricopeptide repeat protein [Candidatus Uabimicrobium amorphum]BBM81728.1 hypothetical protein UABAM_00067 [Candidatus Uabimicrobium amorphum]
MKKYCFICVLFLSCIVFSDDSHAKIWNKIKEQHITVKFTDAPFADVVHFVRQTTNVNIVIEPKVIHNFTIEGTTVTIELNDVKIKTLLDVLCNFYHLTYSIRNEVLFMAAIDSPSVQPAIEAKSYDLQRFNMRDARNILLKSNAQSGKVIAVKHTRSFVDELVNAIRRNVSPDSWMRRGHSIVAQNKQILVRTSADVHRQIKSFLDDMALLTPKNIDGRVSIYKLHNGKKHQIYTNTFSTLENEFVYMSTKSKDLNIALALSPTIVKEYGIRLQSDIQLANSKNTYHDYGITTVENGVETNVVTYSYGGESIVVSATMHSNYIKKNVAHHSEASLQDREIHNRLHSEVLSVDFSDTPLGDAVDFLRVTTGLNILIDAAVYQEFPEELKFDLNVKRVKLKNLLSLIASSVGLHYKVEKGIVVISTRDRVVAKDTTRVYYVEDLMAVNPLFTDKNILRKASSSFTRILSQNIRPKKWGLCRGILVVCDTQAKQGEVTQLLRTLRRHRYGTQVLISYAFGNENTGISITKRTQNSHEGHVEAKVENRSRSVSIHFRPHVQDVNIHLHTDLMFKGATSIQQNFSTTITAQKHRVFVAHELPFAIDAQIISLSGMERKEDQSSGDKKDADTTTEKTTTQKSTALEYKDEGYDDDDDYEDYFNDDDEENDEQNSKDTKDTQQQPVKKDATKKSDAFEYKDEGYDDDDDYEDYFEDDDDEEEADGTEQRQDTQSAQAKSTKTTKVIPEKLTTIKECDDAITKNPANSDLYLRRGNLYTAQQKYDKAVADFNRAIKLQAKNPQGYILRGKAYVALRRYRQALQDFTISLALNPQNAEVYFQRAELLTRQKRYDMAYIDYNKSIKLNPNNAEFYIGRGLLNLENRRFQNALNDYNDAIRIDPKNAQAYGYSGIAYQLMKNNRKAMRYYSKAITLDPKNVNAYANRARLFFNLKKYEKGLKDCNAAISIEAKNSMLYLLRGHMHNQMQKYALALKDWETAITLGYPKQRIQPLMDKVKKLMKK